MAPLTRTARNVTAQRAAPLTATVLDDRARRVRLSFSSETPYLRSDLFGFDEPWVEVLGHKAGEVDLSRLGTGGAPVLWTHNVRDRAAHVGVIERAWLEGGRAYADVRLSSREDVADLWRDIAEGVVSNVSVGYQILERTLIRRAADAPAEYRVTRWLPMEISFVAVPADASVGVGRAAQPSFPAAPMGREHAMEDDTHPQGASPAGTDHPDPAALATRAERARVAQIRKAVSAAGLEDRFSDQAIDQGLTIEATRELVVNELARRDVNHRPHRIEGGFVMGNGVDATEGPRDGFTRACTDALLQRAGVPVRAPHPSACDLAGMSVIEMARSFLSQGGRRSAGLTPTAVLQRAMSTSDFPLVLTGAVGASIRNGYESEPASHRTWTRGELVPDFRDQERPLLGSAPALLAVGELGEYKHGSLTEDSTKYKVAKFGRIVALSWETLVNDRLGAFLRVQPGMGMAARRLEADTVYALFAENAGAGPTMQDAVTLFHASHGNLASAGAMDTATLGAARTLLRKQTALGGGYLALAPRFLIVPVELETQAEILLAAATRVATRTTSGSTRTDVEGVTPEWIARLELVVEPRLADSAFYLAADSAQIDTVVVGRLDDDGGAPVLEEEREFNRDALRWKVRHVHGAAALDWRGLVKVPLA